MHDADTLSIQTAPKSKQNQKELGTTRAKDIGQETKKQRNRILPKLT